MSRKNKKKKLKKHKQLDEDICTNLDEHFTDSTSTHPGHFNIIEDIDLSEHKNKKRKSIIPDGLAFWLLKTAVQKLIIKVPEEKKTKIINAAGRFFVLLARASAEGTARGAIDSIRDN